MSLRRKDLVRRFRGHFREIAVKDLVKQIPLQLRYRKKTTRIPTQFRLKVSEKPTQKANIKPTFKGLLNYKIRNTKQLVNIEDTDSLCITFLIVQPLPLLLLTVERSY